MSNGNKGSGMKVRVAIGFALIVIAAVVIAAQQQAANAVAVDADDIGGVVTSAKGPEAGVWVIAETRGLPTRLAKIVVTDDRGRYLLPDLPKANYDVWVRGYGLVDSQKVKAAPGKTMNLTAVVAPSPKAAAQYYPAAYWMSLLNVPDKTEFPGKGGANNFTANVKSQDHFGPRQDWKVAERRRKEQDVKRLVGGGAAHADDIAEATSTRRRSRLGGMTTRRHNNLSEPGRKIRRRCRMDIDEYNVAMRVAAICKSGQQAPCIAAEAAAISPRSTIDANAQRSRG